MVVKGYTNNIELNQWNLWKRFKEQAGYLDIKSRQNNIYIYNVPEGSEGSDMTAFLEQPFQGVTG